MSYGMEFEIAKLHIDDMLRDAERERLAKLASDSRRRDDVEAAGFRERFARLIGSLPLVPNGPRPAGA